MPIEKIGMKINLHLQASIPNSRGGITVLEKKLP